MIIKEKIILTIFLLFMTCAVGMGLYYINIDNKIHEITLIKKSLLKNSKYIIPSIQKQIVNLKTCSVFKNQEIAENQIILTVGKEDIFYKDYIIEVQNISKGKQINEEMMILALEKLINDSTIIQYSLDKGYIKTPNSDIFNSYDKNHAQRLDLILQCEERISVHEFKKISGQGLKIVFSNIESSDLPLSEGREIIRKSVVGLYTDFKSGKISPYNFALNPKSAGFEKIPNLKIGSSSFDFDTSANKKISDSKEFDKLLWQTPVADITPIFHESDSSNQEIYFFGFIKNKTDNGYESINDFYKKNINLYEISIY